MSKTPDSWAMPDDLSKKINEMLNNKPLSPEDELADALEEMARDVAIIEPDPNDWAGRVMYFVYQLEDEAKRRRRGFDFNSVLSTLVNELQDRMRGK